MLNHIINVDDVASKVPFTSKLIIQFVYKIFNHKIYIDNLLNLLINQIYKLDHIDSNLCVNKNNAAF